MPDFKKELTNTLKENSYISRNFSKIIAKTVNKMHGINNIKGLVPKILELCEYLSNKTGYYKKDIQNLKNTIYKKNNPNNFELEEIYKKINNPESNKGIFDYFSMDKQKWILPYFKDKLNVFINKTQRNQDIKDLLSIMNRNYPMIDTAVCLLV
jgi:hypothetical protein